MLGKISTTYAGIIMDSVMNWMVSCCIKLWAAKFKCLSISGEIFFKKFNHVIKLFQTTWTLVNTEESRSSETLGIRILVGT